MSEQIPQTDHTETQVPARPHPAQENRVSAAFARIGLTQMTLAVLTAVFLWQWLDGQRTIGDMQRQLGEKISEMSVGSKAHQLLLAQSQEQVRDLSVKVAMLESHYAEAQNQRAALETLYNELSVSRDETALAEVEQLLLIAAQQLQLSVNVKASLIAMQSADQRLQRMDRAAFNGLRTAIGRDMDKLRALPSIDVTGINLKLNDLIFTVDGLPLIYQQRIASEPVQQTAPPENGTVWNRLWREFWQEVKQLVRIENTGKAEIPLLPPDQEFFLRENLKLRLLAARLALLSRDESSFRQELKTALLWTARYFDIKSAPVIRVQAELQRLAASNISIEVPDIGASLLAVRNYRLTREHATERNLPQKAAR